MISKLIVWYKLMCTYVRRIKSNVKWKKLLMKNPQSPFICKITPSIIVYVSAIIKNGKDICVIRPRIPEQVPRKRQGCYSARGMEGRERVVYRCGTRKGWSSSVEIYVGFKTKYASYVCPNIAYGAGENCRLPDIREHRGIPPGSG